LRFFGGFFGAWAQGIVMEGVRGWKNNEKIEQKTLDSIDVRA